MEKSGGHAFISYVRENSDQVDNLQRTLEAAGVSVWRDTADLWPGEDWRMKIRRAITDNALVFIACFSSQSLARKKTYQNEELLLAIGQLRLRRPDDPWLIPVRFDDCDIPDLEIGGDRTLTSIQRADVFGAQRDAGIARLVATIVRILRQGSDLSISAQPASTRPSVGVRDESNLENLLPFSKTNQRAGERPYRSGAKAIGATVSDSTAMNSLPKVSGRNSKVLEIDLAAGRYLVSWSKEGDRSFFVHDDSERRFIVIGDGKISSGGKVVHLKESGIHLLSVTGDNLEWTFEFAHI